MAIAMLIAIGISFAAWDITAVKATNGDLSSYANAKVGESVFFGQYYQTGEKDLDDPTEYKKTPIEWIVVDKDERTGQLTLMSKYILAAGSYFGNYYMNSAGTWGHYYETSNTQTGGNPYNQAYVDSTARAFLNNLERRDLGGDSYVSNEYKTSAKLSTLDGGKLYTSVGFSNRKYNISNSTYQRTLSNPEFKNRPATRGFYDEAFSDAEKSMIVPKTIAGYTGSRWPNNSHEISEKTYVEGVVDKVWLPSVTELNMMAAEDDNTNPSDEVGSTVFEYFEGKTGTELQTAIRTTRTPFLSTNSKAMNYSIPVYKFNSTEINEDIHTTNNSDDYYWTRSPKSNSYSNVRYMPITGSLEYWNTGQSSVGVRPCVILKY